MPAIVTATVIRWEVEDEEEPTFYNEKLVSTYVGEADDGSLEVMIIAKYILEEASEEDQILELLEAARDGLLQVTNIEKREVKPPSAPPRHPAPEEPKRKRRERKRKTPDSEPDAASSA